MTTESRLVENRSESRRVIARWEMDGRAQWACWAMILVLLSVFKIELNM